MNENAYTKRTRVRNSLYQLDLFKDYLRGQDFQAAHPEARRLAARHGVSIRHAALLMELNSLGPQ
jgi:hypothetical protein